MDILFQALSDAVPVWEQAIDRVTWYHGVVFAIYLGAAWLCVLNGHIAKESREPHSIWFAAALLLCVLGANTVLHGDFILTHVLRSVAKHDGWYGERRRVQYLVVGVLPVMAWFAAGWLHKRFHAGDDASRSVSWGLAALLVIVATRAVSAHGTDQVMNLRLGGISIGRLLEFSAIGWVVLGALRRLRVR